MNKHKYILKEDLIEKIKRDIINKEKKQHPNQPRASPAAEETETEREGNADRKTSRDLHRHNQSANGHKNTAIIHAKHTESHKEPARARGERRSLEGTKPSHAK